MTNREVADVLNNIADLLQIREDNFFKVNAYRKAARSIYHLEHDLRVLYENRRLEDIPGVGRGIKEKIEELMEKGSCDYYEKLLQEIPAGVLDMLAIPGMGHKTIKIIYEHLGIDNLEDLLEAARDKRIRTLPGLGEKTEYNIIKGIEMLGQNSGKFTLGIALPLAEDFRDYLLGEDEVDKAVIVGSVRRGKPLVSDIDLLVSSRAFEKVRDRVLNYHQIKKILCTENDHIKGILSYNVEFEVIMVTPEDFFPRLIWTTGSREHRTILKQQYDFDSMTFTSVKSEAEVYALLNLPYIDPELRECRGEFEAAEKERLPELLKLTDIKGDLHVHSDWSDGAHKIKDMIARARDMGYSYLAITDHSKSLPISGGINEEKLTAQNRVIEELNRELKGFRVLKGIEVDILRDGRLDFDDEVLSRLDIVIASVHSHFNLDKEKQTERIINAIKNKNVDIIGHLTGRLLNRRSGYELDVDQILEAAAQSNVALEINSHPDRLDIDEEIARQAKALGIKIVVNSDAHDKNGLSLVKYGVADARRGWLEKGDVLNTMDIESLMSWLARR